MDTTPTETPASPEKPSEPSQSEKADSETTEQQTHEQIQAELRALLEEVQTSFRPFEETIFTKIDAMQEKINELGNSVADLSVTTKPADAASGVNESPSRGEQEASDYIAAPEP